MKTNPDPVKMSDNGTDAGFVVHAVNAFIADLHINAEWLK
jgi:hypothetical protein